MHYVFSTVISRQQQLLSGINYEPLHQQFMCENNSQETLSIYLFSADLGLLVIMKHFVLRLHTSSFYWFVCILQRTKCQWLHVCHSYSGLAQNHVVPEMC